MTAPPRSTSCIRRPKSSRAWKIKRAKPKRGRSRCAKASLKNCGLPKSKRDTAERARREVVNELNGKLQDVSRALQQAQSRIVGAEERTVAAEFRAQAAEAKLYRANQELAAVEEAIRKRLL